MSFKVIYGDATTYKGDAILNSLGTNGAVYGRLCKNVIEKINRPAVKKLIDEQVNMAVGTIIETEGGDMNCEHVIHIVTPFRKDEVSVSGNKKLIAAYQSVVDYAIKKGYKSIGLPFIGTGANGYSESEAYDALIDVTSRISDREVAENVDILDITILGYLQKTSYGERRPLNSRRNYREVGDSEEECIRLGLPAYFGTFKHMTKSSVAKVLKDRGYNDAAINAINDENSPFWIAKFMSDLDPNKFFKPNYKMFTGKDNSYSYKYPYDFVRDYCLQNGIDEYMALREFDVKERGRIYKRSISKLNIYRFAILLKWPKEVVVQYMTLCGHSFSPWDEVDRFFFKGLKDGFDGPVRTLYELDSSYKRATNKTVFSYSGKN